MTVEIQRIVAKLPDWLSSRWNRIATVLQDEHKAFPDFKSFVQFLNKEARIACNPITSLQALKSTEQENSRQSDPDHKLHRNRNSTQINLSVTYTREYIPAYKSDIPTCKTAKVWPHLEHLVDEMSPELDCEMGMLIGYNCPQALLPRNVVSGKEGQPFAQKSVLG